MYSSLNKVSVGQIGLAEKNLQKMFLLTLTTVGLLLTIIAPVTPQADVTTKNGVLILTNKNFNSVIEENEFVLVMFYAPWCGACKSAHPQFEKAAQELEEKGSVAKLGEVDVTVHKSLGGKYRIEYIPDVRLFRNGKEETKYNGARSQKAFVTWVEKMLAQG